MLLYRNCISYTAQIAIGASVYTQLKFSYWCMDTAEIAIGVNTQHN